MTTAKGYTEMKDSGIEWVGMIPATWDVFPAGGVFDEVKEKNVNNQYSNPFSFRYGEIVDKIIVGEIDESVEETLSAYRVVSPNTIMINGLNLNYDFISQRVAIVREKGIITPAYLAVQPDEGRIVPRFVLYLLKAYDYRQVFHGVGSGIRKTLKFQDFKSIKIVAPSLTEQTAIAAYLDAQCAKIDEIIAQAKASIEDYKQWKASIIYEAVTKGLNPNVEMKDSGVEWIGKVPKEWKAIPLKVCTSKIGSGKTPQGGAETYQDNGVLFLRSQNVYNTGLELDGVYYISDEIDSTMKNSRVRYNDVLLNITGGSIGRCCLFDLPDTAANVNQHVCIIRTKPEILLPQFLRYFWNSAAGPMVIDQYQTGSNRQGLNFEQIGATHIPLCSIAEQRQIVAMLDQKCAVIDQLMAEKQSLIDDLESYKKSLIYEVVTGKRYIR